jgi:hypothetical protein
MQNLYLSKVYEQSKDKEFTLGIEIWKGRDVNMLRNVQVSYAE